VPRVPVVRVRTILHVDMDAFYVSVELRRRPDLVGQPVVVGGSGARGVVAAASYEARRFGIFSAMPGAKARRLCPHAVFLPGDHALYGEVSREVHDIFASVTPLVEGIALDEAFLDVTGARRLWGAQERGEEIAFGVEIAHRLRAEVADRLQLACSVGVAPNKFLAKLASKAAKPRATAQGVEPGAGVVEVRPGDELAFVRPLPVRSLWGVGPATFERLDRLGIRTVGDLADLGEGPVCAALGRAHGQHLVALANALDDRPVVPTREPKSIGHEETFAQDLHTYSDMMAEIVRLSDAVASRLRHHGVGARTMTLKVRFAGFQTITRSVTLTNGLTTGPGIVAALEPLVAEVDPTPGIRLLGVSGSHLGPPLEQLGLFEQPGAPDPQDVDAIWSNASETLDEIRDRFGDAAIGPASLLDRRRSRPGGAKWGPGTGHGEDPSVPRSDPR
jgi:DNA polymerase IV